MSSSLFVRCLATDGPPIRVTQPSGLTHIPCAAHRGMRLADTVFLTMPVALLQVWLGMHCSRPGMHCRVFLGHQSFNILLLISIIASIIGAPPPQARLAKSYQQLAYAPLAIYACGRSEHPLGCKHMLVLCLRYDTGSCAISTADDFQCVCSMHLLDAFQDLGRLIAMKKL